MLRRVVACLAVIAMTLSLTVNAMEPYNNYTYDSDENLWLEPQAYYADHIILGSELGIGDFEKPSDVFVAEDGRIYIADTGNNRIVILKSDGTPDREIKSFQNNGKQDSLLSPQGIFVTEDNTLYIADTENKRIVILGADGNLLREITEPNFNVDQSFSYAPYRISVDNAGRMFIVSKNINYGMIELDKNGEFSSFYGAIKVSSSLVDALWRKIATQKQKEKMIQNVPTEYSSNAIDKDGFIYGTISTQDAEHFIRKLNSLGIDVLRRMGAVAADGDVGSLDEKGNVIRSSLADICVMDNGVYSVLDSKRGRVFTYNNDGSLMYVFGALGTQKGCFVRPTALDVTKDHTYLVLDSGSNKIVCFKPTEYAEKINTAVELQFLRDYSEAEKVWMDMLKYSSKSEMAYSEIGKAYYRQGSYQKAMEYFEMANDRDQYSKAYKEYRRQIMNDSFGAVMTGLSIIVLVLLVLMFIRRRRKRNRASKRFD